ncbi:MAG: hypothetical protein KF874_08540 [Rhizobiaceae bacterium]|nr:hypothetical protein [Rhizobiaceae bacterium]
MWSSDSHHKDKEAVAARRMISDAQTRRYTAALPQFRVEEHLPPEMEAMLRRLEEAERKARP